MRSTCRPSRWASTNPLAGDRQEPFGGRGASWKGAFVGGDLLVQAVTVGDDDRLYGNFQDRTALPPNL